MPKLSQLFKKLTKLQFGGSLMHMQPEWHVKHDESNHLGNWPWYKVIAFFHCRPCVCHPSTGHRLWIYFRSGGAIFIDVYFDRRTNNQ